MQQVVRQNVSEIDLVTPLICRHGLRWSWKSDRAENLLNCYPHKTIS